MKASGIWLVIIGTALVALGGLFWLLAVQEYSNYSDLKAAGKPFVNLVANNYVYLGGIAAVAVLAGLAGIITGTQLKRDPVSLVGKRVNGFVWDGQNWIAEADWAARSAIGTKQDGYTWDGAKWNLDAP